jgi:hypothetical protein
MRWLVCILLVAACATEVPTAKPQPITSADFAAYWAGHYGSDTQTDYWRDLCKMLSWVTPAVAKDPSCSPVIDRPPSAAYHDEWDIHDWGIALATMYEWSGDPSYLDELGQLDDVLVAGRGGFDAVRGRYYLGWVIDRGCQWGSLDVTGLLGELLARYARLVSERPDLGSAYAARANSYAAVAAAALADTPDDEKLGDATHLLYITTPHASPACTAQITRPGMPYPYNMDHLMMGTATDLAVAWANGIGGDEMSDAVAIASADLPRLWEQWCGDAVAMHGSDTVLQRWPSGSSPDGKDLVEDSSHAAVTIELTTRIERETDALAAIAPAGSWVDAGPLDDGFAHTLVDLATLDNAGTWEFPGDMNGEPNDTVYERAQQSCEGWALLSPHSFPGYTRCLDVTFQVVGDTEPNVTPGDIAALGWMTAMARP